MSKQNIVVFVLIGQALMNVTPSFAQNKSTSKQTPKCPAGMSWVQGGSYPWGSDEVPVLVKGICLDRNEVTVADYIRFEKPPVVEDSEETEFCNGDNPDKQNHPMNCVDWDHANRYCKSVGKRLPTEEEWEWAARGGTRGWAFAWGNEPPDGRACWHRQLDGTCPVGSFPKGDSPQGIKDLSGNVSEWTATGWEGSRFSIGGSFYSPESGYLRSNSRVATLVSDVSDELGFRCANDP